VLDVALHGVSFAYRNSDFALRDIDLVFHGGSCTAVTGAGTSTLLALIAGDLKPDKGEILIGTRPVTKVKRSRRPLLFVSGDIDVPRRWSVRHALVAAVRTRTLDRVDRQMEYEHVLEKWRLTPLAGRRLADVSSSERTRAHLASIELRRPGILVADGIAFRTVADDFFRTLRVLGTTVIFAPQSTAELGSADRVVVLDRGSVAQAGRPAQVFAAPLGEAAALATGDANLIPVAIKGNVVDSIVGEWDIAAAPFQGTGVAIARPDDFEVAAPGEESDLIFNIEEASFVDGRWLATGILSGGFLLRVALPRTIEVRKGKLLALRYDPKRFSLLQKDIAFPQRSAPLDAIPPMSETR
jgi:ABC-type sugar transport system ATPase subunit